MNQIRRILASFVVLLLVIPMTNVAAATFKEKIHYEKIVPAQPVSTDGKKVEVVEMFWYGCPHCNKLEPYVNRWVKKMPKNTEFIRMPAIFRPGWELHARAFYTSEILGVVDKTHTAMFEAIHGKRQKMNTEKAIMDLFGKFGVSNKDFKRVFKSFAVEAKIRRAKDMSRRYGIKGVPALIVNGKYRTGGHQAGGNNKVFKVVNYLIEKESK